MKTKKKGFTLVELVIVISVIAILAAVLIPTFSAILQRAKDSADYQRVKSAIKDYYTNNFDTIDQMENYVVMVNDNYYLILANGELSRLDVDSLDDVESGFAYSDQNSSVVAGVVIYEPSPQFAGYDSTNDIMYSWDELIDEGILTLDYEGTEIQGWLKTSNVDVLNIDSSISSIADNAFKNCTNLKSVKMTNNITSIGQQCFYGCHKLENLVLSHSLTSIPYRAFYCCHALKAIDLFEGLESVGEEAFLSCYVAPELDIPESLTTVGPNAFIFCYGVTELFVPITLTNIGNGAFSSLKGLENLVIEEGRTTIVSRMFDECTSLRSVVIPESIEQINTYAFYNCYALRRVYNLSNINIQAGSTSNGYVGYYAYEVYNTLNPQETNIVDVDGVMYYKETEDSFIAIGTTSNEYTSITLDERCYKIDDHAFANSQITEISMNNVEEIEEYAFMGSTVESVVFSDCLSSIGECAFYQCENLGDIEVPYSVEYIGDSAFAGCLSITNAQIHSYGYIGYGIFQDDEYIESITFDGDYVEYLGGQLVGSSNSSLEEVYVYSHVQQWGDGTFSECEALTIAYVCSNTLGNMCFSGCSSLSDLTLDGVSMIGFYAFAECESLTELDLSNVDYIGGDAFRECTGLETVILSDSLYSLDMGLFLGCSSLCNINIPSNITRLEDNLFCGTGFTEFEVPETVTEIGYNTFAYCENLTSITLPDNLEYIGQSAFASCSSLVSIEIPDNVTYLGDDMFNGCSSLTSVILPSGISELGYGFFCGCESLTSMEIPYGVTSIGQDIFSGCVRLSEVTIPETITQIPYYAFRSCTSLYTITIPNSINSIQNYAFQLCDKLVEIYNLSGLTFTKGSDSNGMIAKNARDIYTDENAESKFTTINGVIYYPIENEKYEAIALANPNATSITFNENCTKIIAGAFSSCKYLTSVTIPASITSIGVRAFQYCDALETVVIQSQLTSISGYTFYACKSLENVTLPDSITSIGDCAFAFCESLETITLPSELRTIGDTGFGYCYSMTSIIIPAKVTSIAARGFVSDSNLKTVINLSNLNIVKGAVSYGQVAYHAENVYNYIPE